MVSLWTASRNNTVSVTVTGSVIGTWAFNRVGRAHAATKTTRIRANLARRFDAGFGLCGRGDMACLNQCGDAFQSERFDKLHGVLPLDLTCLGDGTLASDFSPGNRWWRGRSARPTQVMSYAKVNVTVTATV